MLTKIKENSIIAFSAFLLVIVALGYAGTSDYDDQVILHMPQDTYDQISSELRAQCGSEPSDHDIVLEYKNRYSKN